MKIQEMLSVYINVKFLTLINLYDFLEKQNHP